MLNKKFVRYKDLLTIKKYNKKTNKETFILLPLEDNYVFGKYVNGMDMLEYGDNIPVRKTVYKKLVNVAKRIKRVNNNYKLMVVYGFREMKKQEEYFNTILNEVKDKFIDKLECLEYIHEKIAVPGVSGHPTGGAVDIAIFDESLKEILDFGTNIFDYNNKRCYYYSEDIGKDAKKNRKLLRNSMLKEGFAPYDGEWWHFSYGDKEWAYYYKKNEALYNQIKEYKELRF